MRSHLKNLFAPVMIFLLIRLLSVLFSAFSAAPHEEQYTGVMALLLTSDTGISWFELSMGPQEMIGRTVVATLCAGSFQIFGTNLVALKLPAVLLSTVSFLLWHVLLLRMADRFAMWVSALLWFFPPPLIQGISIIPLGNHWENTINFAIVLLCLSIWHERPSEDRWLLLAGLSAGFSIVFCLNALPLVLSALAVLLVLDRKRLRCANLSATAGAFAIPVILFSILMYRRTGSLFSLYNVSSDTVGSVCTLPTIAGRFQQCVLEHLPLSAVNTMLSSTETGDWTRLRFIASVLLLVASLMALLILFRRPPSRRIASISAGYIFLFCCAWSFSGHSIAAANGYMTYRYFSALYPFFFLLIGLATFHVSSPAKRWFARLAILPMIAPNLLFFIHNLDPGSFYRATSANGTLWTTISEWLIYSHDSPEDNLRSAEDRYQLLQSIAGITSPLEREQIAWGIGGNAAVLYRSAPSLTEYIRTYSNMPDDFAEARSALAIGLTSALPLTGSFSPDELAIDLTREPEDFQPEFFTGLGISIGLLNERTGRDNFVTWTLIPEAYRDELAFGYGFSMPIALWCYRSFESGQPIPSVFDHSAMLSFARGFGTAMAWFYPGSLNSALPIEVELLPPDLHSVMETAYYSALNNSRNMSW